MADASSSVYASDIVQDFPCLPCEKSGLNVAGVKYCVDCNENLCSTCLIHHNRFSVTNGHKVLDKVQTCESHSKQHRSKQCRKHDGKIIDVYCPNHDTVGCSTCIALDHRTCEDVKFIPVVATSVDTSKEQLELETEMKTIKLRLDSLKKEKMENIQRLNRDKESLTEEIHQVRKQLNSQLDKMEKELLDEVEEKFKQKIEAINASIADVDFTLEHLEETLTHLKNDEQDSDKFISCKTGKEDMQNILFPKIEELEKLLPERSLELHIDETVQLMIQEKRVFAAVKDKYDVQNVRYKNDKNIHLSDDKKICCIYAVCSLSDGCLVMSDYNNKKLKKLDPVSCNVSKLITLPDNPDGICLVDDTRLAVSLFKKKKVQFVLLANPVKLSHSFTVGDKCRGLAHCGGLLYVCCGGSSLPERNEGRGHVEVYNCEGDLLRCFFDELKLPGYIAVIDDGFNTTMYISDWYKCVQVSCVDGIVKQRFTTVEESMPLPLCLVGNKHAFISEYSAGDMYLHAGENMHLLIEKEDLNGEPSALYIDEKTSRLFVATDNCDVIKIFDVIL